MPDAMRADMGALDPFVAIRQTMPMQYIRSFLAVALDEGKGVNEYKRLLGLNQSVMPRHLSWSRSMTNSAPPAKCKPACWESTGPGEECYSIVRGRALVCDRCRPRASSRKPIEDLAGSFLNWP